MQEASRYTQQRKSHVAAAFAAVDIVVQGFGWCWLLLLLILRLMPRLPCDRHHYFGWRKASLNQSQRLTSVFSREVQKELRPAVL